MGNSKVIVVTSKNKSPQEEIDKALEKFSYSWKVISARTVMIPYGIWDNPAEVAKGNQMGMSIVEGECKHLYFCTTIVLERID